MILQRRDAAAGQSLFLLEVAFTGRYHYMEAAEAKGRHEWRHAGNVRPEA